MIPTYTTSIRESIIENFFANNLVIALISRPSLGITDTPTAAELAARQALNMTDIFNAEIGAVQLNGYHRNIVGSGDINVVVIDTETSEAEITVTFTANGGTMDSFSHIVAIRSADLTGADPVLNGNNRGSTLGEVIFVEPVNNAASPGSALSLSDGTSFDYTFKLISSAEAI